MLTRTLFFLSVLILFLEMLLIRWVSTEVRIFAYLQNTVLVVCLLGLGMGCLTPNKRSSLLALLIPLALLVIALSLPFTRKLFAGASTQLSVMSDFPIWYSAIAEDTSSAIGAIFSGAVLTFVLMFLLWEVFLPLGAKLGEAFDAHPQPYIAYSANIAGSLVGTWLFGMLGFLTLSPVYWVLVLALLIPLAYGRQQWSLKAIALIAVIIACFAYTHRTVGLELHWSSYQKLELTTVPDVPSSYRVWVNNVGYQEIRDFRPETINQHKDFFQSTHELLGHYSLPYRFHPRPEKVLVVGAGTGNDVAAALRAGVERVVAVDIDPVIVDIGKRYHPEQPYDSPKVRVVVDDARAFFNKTEEKFDVVVFGLLDAHTSNAGTNVRLDHYVYTRESMESVRKLLAPGGVVVVTFAMDFDYLRQRFSNLMTEVFGSAPLQFLNSTPAFGWGGRMFVSGDQQNINAQLVHDAELAAFVEPRRTTSADSSVIVATDDWPYLYLRKPGIPLLYGLLAVLLLALYFWQAKRINWRLPLHSWRPLDWHFFFLGAAFMLFEMFAISKAAVVMGNTWLVTAVIVSGIMAMLLVANGLAALWKKRSMWGVYVGLLCSFGLLFVFDFSVLLGQPTWVRTLLLGFILALPCVFSGVIFMNSFAQAAHRDRALGTNLFGALFGAIAQALSFVFGIRALLLIVAALYALAFIAERLAAERLVTANAD